MKKILILLILLLVALPIYVFADNAEKNSSEVSDDSSDSEKKPLYIENRYLEFGILQTRVGLANNHFIPSDIFKEKLVIDLGDFSGGLKINADIGIVPLYFTYHKDNLWGFGLALGLDAAGIIDISGNLLTLSETENDNSFVGGAAFAYAKFSGFFMYKDFKIKINPSLFLPLIYIEGDHNINYTFNNESEASVIRLGYQLFVYTGFPLQEGSVFELTALAGFDFHAGAEYPLAEKLGLKEKYKFLDFTVGVDLYNVPLIPAKMKNYVNISGYAGDGSPVSLDDMENLISIDDPVYGTREKFVLRPFKMLIWADWKPFDTVPVSFIPTLGFGISPLYPEAGSFEAGVKAKYNYANLFIASLGIGYYDRLWKNSLEIALNFRYFEFNIGVEMRSHDFAKSWQGSGLGVYIGFKAGS